MLTKCLEQFVTLQVVSVDDYYPYVIDSQIYISNMSPKL